MTATTAPARQATSTPRPRPISDQLHYVSVRANLLPREVIAARHTEALRRKVIAALVVLVLILAGGYGLSWWQTRSARADLADLTARSRVLQQQQSQFTPLVQAQAGTNTIRLKLQTVMQGDLPWWSVLSNLRVKAPAGVSLVSVTGALSSGVGTSGTSSAATALNQSAMPAVGTLVLTGSAPTKTTVAAFADQLSNTNGISAVMITNVAAAQHGFTFTINAALTSAALGGRYSTTGPTGTGGR